MPHERLNSVRRVLIVDEDVVFSRRLANQLTQDGYEVAIAVTPRDMLNTMRHFNAPVVVYDARLAEATGSELTALLVEGHANAIFVAMAADADFDCAVKAFREGAYDFFAKSHEFAAILAILERCFRMHHVRQQSDAGYEMLWRAKEAAEASNRAKSEFLATMSHELRTPLNAIIGFSEVMMRGMLGPRGNDEYRSYIEDIHASGRHLLDIINDILDFSKAEAGKLELVENEVDVAQSVVALFRLIGPKARDAGLELCSQIPSELPRLWCDERKLKQMLLNLLSNAVKFTPSGGRIDLDADCRPDGMRISVKDTGIGIPESDIARVLQPFVQLENTLSRKNEGTGLGLPLVKAMVEIHGGALCLESAPGVGTCVRLIFPLERVTSSYDHAPAAERA